MMRRADRTDAEWGNAERSDASLRHNAVAKGKGGEEEKGRARTEEDL